MAVRYESQPECTEAQLCHRPVIEDLSADVHVLNIVLQQNRVTECGRLDRILAGKDYTDCTCEGRLMRKCCTRITDCGDVVLYDSLVCPSGRK